MRSSSVTSLDIGVETTEGAGLGVVLTVGRNIENFWAFVGLKATQCQHVRRTKFLPKVK